jgi:hypothetical protein
MRYPSVKTLSDLSFLLSIFSEKKKTVVARFSKVLSFSTHGVGPTEGR